MTGHRWVMYFEHGCKRDREWWTRRMTSYTQLAYVINAVKYNVIVFSNTRVER